MRWSHVRTFSFTTLGLSLLHAWRAWWGDWPTERELEQLFNFVAGGSLYLVLHWWAVDRPAWFDRLRDQPWFIFTAGALLGVLIFSAWWPR